MLLVVRDCQLKLKQHNNMTIRQNKDNKTTHTTHTHTRRTQTVRIAFEYERLLTLGFGLVVVVKESKEDQEASSSRNPVLLFNGKVSLGIPGNGSRKDKVHNRHPRQVSLHISCTLTPLVDQVADKKSEDT